MSNILKQGRYLVLGGSRGTVKRCWELLTDVDGFQARCTQVYGTEHSHHNQTAREAVAQRLATTRAYGLGDK